METKKHLTGLENERTYRAFFANSSARGNLIAWYDIPKNSTVLVVNETEGSMTSLLEEKGAKVTAVMAEDLWELPEQSFDIILHLGAVGEEKTNIEAVYEKYFTYYKAHLKDTGALLLAVPNRLGLRYFAGCQDEEYDSYFAGIEGYGAGMTKQALSKKEYEKLLQKAGFLQIDNYYPYPDYRFPVAVYSEEWLPTEGELNANIRNFDKDRYVLFDEGKGYNSLIREGLYQEFANSFLYICHAAETEKKEKVLFSKFSNERAAKFQIRTDIVKKSDGTYSVIKYPLTKEAEAHVKNMQAAYEGLKSECSDEQITFCPVTWNGKGAESSFAKGTSLQEILHQKLEAGEEAEAIELVKAFLKRYRNYLSGRKQSVGAETKQYEKNAGNPSTVYVNDIDMVFSNVLVDGDTWNVIDYEWSFVAEVPDEFMVYRVLFRASIDFDAYEAMKLSNLLALAGIDEEKAAEYLKMEETFQKYISGDEIPVRDMIASFGRQVIPFAGNKSEQDRQAERLLNLHGSRAIRIVFSIDKTEKKNGKVVCSGWACAKVRGYGYIPVEIRIFDEEGNTIQMPAVRTSRKDAAAVLKGNCIKEECIGFDAVFYAAEGRKYAIRFSAGKCQKEIWLTGVDN